MSKTLPKGHVSCLTEGFRYTPAASTDIAKTFARLRQQLEREEPRTPKNVRVLPHRKLAPHQAQ
jgi:hypothetical protein